jgi:hypothetical protein
MDEATLGIWAATESQSFGRSGISLVARATSMSQTTIHGGIKELKAKENILREGRRKSGFMTSWTRSLAKSLHMEYCNLNKLGLFNV